MTRLKTNALNAFVLKEFTALNIAFTDPSPEDETYSFIDPSLAQLDRGCGHVDVTEPESEHELGRERS